jgi:hypothetical protein
MIVYSSNLRSYKYLLKLIFRSSFKKSIKNVIKIIAANKKTKNAKYNYVAFTHKRSQENRVYGILERDENLFFFKVSEKKFNSIFENIQNNIESLFDVSEKLIPSYYKHRILSRIEFENLGFGLKKTIYHGDISKGNILVYKNDIKLIDDEYKGTYTELYQNVDYLINLFEYHKIEDDKFYDINWWHIIVQMYSETDKKEVINVFKKRLLNGCNFSSKIV